MNCLPPWTSPGKARIAAVAIDLDRLSWAAASLKRPERAVILGGAASRLREAVGSGLTQQPATVQGFRWDTEDPRQSARDVLAPSEIEVAWARGRSMRPQKAVAYASGTRRHPS